MTKHNMIIEKRCEVCKTKLIKLNSHAKVEKLNAWNKRALRYKLNNACRLAAQARNVKCIERSNDVLINKTDARRLAAQASQKCEAH